LRGFDAHAVVQVRNRSGSAPTDIAAPAAADFAAAVEAERVRDVQYPELNLSAPPMQKDPRGSPGPPL
jgi:hypothetical protein